MNLVFVPLSTLVENKFSVCHFTEYSSNPLRDKIEDRQYKYCEIWQCIKLYRKINHKKARKAYKKFMCMRVQ